MPFRVSGKNIDIGAALRTRINQRLVQAAAKYFDRGFSGRVTIGKEGFGFRTECVLHLDSGIVLETDALAADAYASADQAALRLEKRLRRYKRRLKDHQTARGDGHAPERAPRAPAAQGSVVTGQVQNDAQITDSSPAIIAESIASLKRLSVREAVMELDLTGASVLVFRHAGHGRVNLVYRRADGHIGWIDPPASAQDAH